MERELGMEEANDNRFESIMNSIFPGNFYVMVIDDHPTSLVHVIKRLQECKFKVAPCHPYLALDVLQEKRHMIFLLLVINVHMRDIDAFTFLEQIRKTCNLPAIMLTLVPAERVGEKCLEYPDCYHIHFPFHVRKLIGYAYSAVTNWEANNVSRASQGSPQLQPKQADEARERRVQRQPAARKVTNKSKHKGESSGTKSARN